LYAIGLTGPVVLYLISLAFSRWAICGPPAWAGEMLVTPSSWLMMQDGCASDNTVKLLSESESIKVALYYLGAAAVIIVFFWTVIDANRTSLHGYYRDRLSKAFLIRRPPGSEEDAPPERNDRQRLESLGGKPIQEGYFRRFVVVPVRQMASRISHLRKPMSTATPRAAETSIVAPYHLINAAVNVQKAETSSISAKLGAHQQRSPDLRGRKADYFLFSQEFVGSAVTGYCRTAAMTRLDPHVNLGTAMAVSGAAAAPNMGTSTVRPLVFILTMLNVRLGYWMPNPRLANRLFNGRFVGRGLVGLVRMLNRVGPFYLLMEMFGQLHEGSRYVNVSDGGHIENLGLYPLLQRRCRLIIAVDAEQDPPRNMEGSTSDDADNKNGIAGHRFSGLAAAIRHARIDMGIDIDFLADAGLEHIGQNSKDGRHFAIAYINYGKDFPPGWLVYIKASLSGDENVYVRERRSRHPDFPHELTLDQFFDEAQFESYRALGHHAAKDLLDPYVNSDRNKQLIDSIVKGRPGPPRVGP
jgi:hypothetical protein